MDEIIRSSQLGFREDLSKYIVEGDTCNDGIRFRLKFDNGYGGSVVRHSFSYGGDRGLWELAVLIWDGNTFDLCYDTEITDDVLGYLEPAEVVEILYQIKALEPWNETPQLEAPGS